MRPTTANRMQSHWDETRAFLKRNWPKLTEVDLDEIDGEYDRLVLKIQDLYGGAAPITQEAPIKKKIQDFLNGLESEVS